MARTNLSLECRERPLIKPLFHRQDLNYVKKLVAVAWGLSIVPLMYLLIVKWP